MTYDPKSAAFPSFSAARRGFAEGKGSPREFLEQCIAALEAREREVKAFVSYDLESARKAADAATQRWQDGAPLSAVDGLPFGVKDCYDVAGLQTLVNSPWFADSAPAEFDAAHVAALKDGGAFVFGKTTTTEFTMALPAPTWNPWDLTRTPGGSSTGSAAAVASSMLPLATGSQVRGSVIRPASICGVAAFKPTFGALNRHGGIDPSPSVNHLGLLGATMEDIWDAARQIAVAVGGDPGHLPLDAAPLPEPKRPLRLARQYTIGWDKTDDASKAIFEEWLEGLKEDGVEIVEPGHSQAFSDYEDATTRTIEFFFHLFWEIRWPWLEARERAPDKFSHVMHGHLDNAAKLTIEDYRRALECQAQLQSLHRALKDEVDGFVTLAHIGAGQKGAPEMGTPWYNDASSAVGAPTANLPLLSVDGMPLGVQLMGFEHRDAQMIAHARWLLARGKAPSA